MHTTQELHFSVASHIHINMPYINTLVLRTTDWMDFVILNFCKSCVISLVVLLFSFLLAHFALYVVPFCVGRQDDNETIPV